MNRPAHIPPPRRKATDDVRPSGCLVKAVSFEELLDVVGPVDSDGFSLNVRAPLEAK